MEGIRIEREGLVELGSALGRRWLATDGRGGYASSTVVGCNTTRHDGLLVAPFRGTARPHLFLSRFEEELCGGGKTFPLSMARYPGTWHPAGHQFLDLFEADPVPRSTYRIGDVTVVREVRMVRGASTVLVRWTIEGSSAPEALRLRPFLPCREAGALTRENVYLDARTKAIPGGFSAHPYPSLPELSVTLSPAAPFHADPRWYGQVEFEDGEHEDQFTPGEFVVPVADGTVVVAAASIEGPVEDPAALWRREERRGPGTAADAFLARVGGRPVVVAGFPSPPEGAREALIALPGLTLARGKVKECGEILASYVSSDATLWWIRAVGLFAKAGGSAKRFAPAVLAAVEDLPPASGVEEAALRIEALAVAARFAKGKSRAGLEARRKEESRRFSPGDGPITPGMVIAASLESTPLTKSRRAAVVDAARADLLTPRGLRTLSPRDPAYRPDAAEAGAAHPWLLGFYAEAMIRAKGRTAAVRREIRGLVEGFAAPLTERCLGHVSERFDGDSPHHPAGAFAHAPATGELLRALRLAGAAP